MTQQRGSAPDPIGDFQRWLMRSGARGMTREVSGHLTGMLGLGGKTGDVWETATAPWPAEAPECAWCPVCRAARLLRESGPGLASHVSSASDAFAAVVQEASTVVESVLAAAGRRPGAGQDSESGPGPVWDAATDEATDAAPDTASDTDAGAGWDSPAGSAWEQAIGDDTAASANGSGTAGPAGGTPAAGPPGPPAE